MEQTTVLDELNLVAKTLTTAEKYNLECEVILSALKHMQDHPGCSIDDALYAGLASWDI